MSLSINNMLLLIAAFLSFLPLTLTDDTTYVQITTNSGDTVLVADDRKPSLYTDKFGDCLGSSVVNVTRFDAAYYQDNMTVLFHLEGKSNLANESVMSESSPHIAFFASIDNDSVYIGVFAYGESRFNLTFDPCHAQIYRYGIPMLKCRPSRLIAFSLCPMNRSVPIEANGVIPVSQSDVAGIPAIALSIPDFEGQAILRIFGNSTQSEIGCYSAIVTNGGTFSHPAAVGTILGLFTLAAVIASFATTVYGDHIPTMRTHYAHSLSVFVVFAVLQHIYFTGALSMNWPSVAVAWWSNFAWAGGMIYSESMQNSINQLIGSNKGNVSMVGAASSGSSADSVGGGYDLSSIYSYQRLARDLYKRWAGTVKDVEQLLRQRSLEGHIAKRAASSDSVSSPWFGKPVKPGLPIPGNFSGFAGTLSEQNIPASNAFMTGFLWFFILLTLIAFAIIIFKLTLEGLSKKNLLRTERLAYFRTHWKTYTIQVIQRATFIAFFMMMFLAMFEFTFWGHGGVTAIAALVFIIILVSTIYWAFIACHERLRLGHYEVKSNRFHFEKRRFLGFVPWLGFELDSRRSQKSDLRPSLCSLPIKSIHYFSHDPQRIGVHQDEEFVKRRGWLTARFRRTRWWFFTAWLLYEFIRACFYAGAAGHPMTQVFGLLVVEIFALITIIAAKPFEGARLNALMVYLLGFSKVATLALSAAFDPRFNLARITTTVVGVVIIVIQGILTIMLMIAIVIGAISSYMSLTRNHEEFKPRSWTPFRERYFAHLEKAAADVPPPPPPPPEKPKEPYFDVKAVRRETKIEDDKAYPGNVHDARVSRTSVASPGTGPATTRTSRANSFNQLIESQSNLPFGAKNVHHTSWSTRDLDSFGNVDSARSSRHMSAALGLHQSRPSSQHMSMYALPHHQNSEGSLRRPMQPPVARTPHKDATILNVRKSRPGTSTAKAPERNTHTITFDERNRKEDSNETW